MRAILLSAGLGTRLKPLTDQLPKALVPIAGRALLEYWAELLSAGGIEKTLVNLHAHADKAERWFAAMGRHGGLPPGFFEVVREPELLGSGGTYLAQRRFFEGGPGKQGAPVILIHGDNVSLFSIAEFIKAHAERPANTAMTMLLFKSPTPQSCGIVKLDAQGRVIEFHEKSPNPPGNLANGAVYILEPEVLQYVQSLGKAFVDFSTEVLPRFVGRIATYMNDVYHRDIGTPESYLAAQLEFPFGTWIERHPGFFDSRRHEAALRAWSEIGTATGAK